MNPARTRRLRFLPVLLVAGLGSFLAGTRFLVTQSIRQALKPDGRLVVIEYRKEDATIPIAGTHRMSASDIRAEIGAAGFSLDKLDETLPRQHIVIFRKAAADTWSHRN